MAIDPFWFFKVQLKLDRLSTSACASSDAENARNASRRARKAMAAAKATGQGWPSPLILQPVRLITWLKETAIFSRPCNQGYRAQLTTVSLLKMCAGADESGGPPCE